MREWIPWWEEDLPCLGIEDVNSQVPRELLKSLSLLSFTMSKQDSLKLNEGTKEDKEHDEKTENV